MLSGVICKSLDFPPLCIDFSPLFSNNGLIVGFSFVDKYVDNVDNLLYCPFRMMIT